MTGQRVLPNLGLTDRWTPGTSGWAAGMDNNLSMLDALLFLTVLSATTAEPSSPAQGDRYIVPVGASTPNWTGKDNKVAVWLDSAWEFFTPSFAWTAHIQDQNLDTKFNGATWTLGGAPYDVAIWRFKLPTNPAEPIISIQLPRTVVFPLGFSGSRCSFRTATTNAITLPVFQNGTQIGTVNGAAGASNGTFTLASGVTFATGDIFEVFPPATPDPTAGGLRLTFVGNR